MKDAIIGVIGGLWSLGVSFVAVYLFYFRPDLLEKSRESSWLGMYKIKNDTPEAKAKRLKTWRRQSWIGFLLAAGSTLLIIQSVVHLIGFLRAG